MTKNTVNDPVTDQEIAFVHLVVSGIMNDRRAAEAVGLNPDSTDYIKSKPCVRDYMLEHRAAVREKLVDQEADGLRKLNPDRSQILTRLWELANLSPEVTRGSITGQVKAVSLIVAIEGLIPDRRASASQTQPTAPPVKAEIYRSEWLRRQQDQSANEQPANPVAANQAPPAAPQVPDPEPSPSLDQNKQPNHSSPANPALFPKELNWVPDSRGCIPDPVLDADSSLRQPFRLPKGPFGRRRY